MPHHFRQLINKFSTALGKPDRKVLSAMGVGNTAWEDGVDFEQPDEIAGYLNQVFAALCDQHGIRATDVIVDITGGVARCAAVGAVVSLDRNRRFQYVNHDGQTLTCDMDYAPQEHA